MNIKPFIFYSVIASTTFLYGCGGTEQTTDSSTEQTDSSTTTTSTGLVINETVASPSDTTYDWIELYATEDIADLSVFSLVDDNADREPQALPAVALSQGEFIVIQAIDETDTPPDSGYYVTFKLGSDDAVTLYEDGTAVSVLDWEEGEAAEGFSYGLYTDGTGTAQTLTPTEGAANQTADTSSLVTTLIAEDAPLRINEVVAKDSSGGEDWIELYVTSSSDVYLADYTLSDDNNEQFALPDITLSPGEFYRIYASTDDLGDLPSVAFKLGASDTVSLYSNNVIIEQLSWNKGQALSGYSYGRYPDGSDATTVLTPTELSSNSQATHGPLVINEIVASAADDGNDWFELYNNSENTINLANYHVIDESDDIDPVTLPDIDLYAGEYITIYATDEDPGTYYVPFKLGKEDELNLILNDEVIDYIDWDKSDVATGFSYGLSSSTGFTHAFLTPTPSSENTVAIAFTPTAVNTLSITISDENWQDILDNPLDEQYHETAITFNGVTLDSVAIRTKGGSSLSSVANSSSDRYSFKVDINEYVSGQKFFGLKKFTLQNSFNDPSYMREVIAYELMDEMGVPTPEHAYVNFYVNGELFGLYLMVEAVDGEFVEKHFANSNGDLYKPDGTGSDLLWLGDDIQSYTDINLQTNEDTTDNGAFINFVESLDKGETSAIDIDTLLRYMSVSTSLSNLDSYHGPLAHNYYIYDDDGVFSILPWDFNESFGTFNMDCNSVDVRELYIDEPVSGALSERPLIANVFAEQSHLDTYHSYLTQLINGSLSSDTFNARVNEIADLIREHVQNDPTSFYGSTYFEQNLTSTTGQFYGLTSFMEYRVANMAAQLDGTLPSAGDGSGFCAR
ncbi:MULTISPECIES: CotH kinase family protein [unclassified Pseudoalteromonas]|uniref:CotH kinase family protein n=1 Tax=unclassified Pseudoalteromonas TaxID=194690 RepID=UPI00041B170B|nr:MULTISPECIES: CotH kinase family protein [unclassified Pseudoalteromonas]MDC9496760.1 CotH kinase family protein [Pseudoalteromonas sp. Angola-20]MDC9516552.1 CotH kinase family protein [Pseudoalteromonas sp. Angola-22]MDC9532951.1 CotH kinase family protein [Pseudoalteromonas sp. Angola-9]TMP84310.1 spore coat protein CotH [Pseudoalteromonas sp. S983]